MRFGHKGASEHERQQAWDQSGGTRNQHELCNWCSPQQSFLYLALTTLLTWDSVWLPSSSLSNHHSNRMVVLMHDMLAFWTSPSRLPSPLPLPPSHPTTVSLSLFEEGCFLCHSGTYSSLYCLCKSNSLWLLWALRRELAHTAVVPCPALVVRSMWPSSAASPPN